jgi:hypothetical protein
MDHAKVATGKMAFSSLNANEINVFELWVILWTFG